VRVEISHLKALGRANHGRTRDAIARIGAARDRGLRVTADAYPYTAGATFLSQVLPPWVHDGGNDELVARIRTTEVRGRIRREIETGLPGWSNYVDAAGGWHGIRIAAAVDPGNAHLEGGLVDELAARLGEDPLDLVLDALIRDRGATLMIAVFMHPDDVDAVVRPIHGRVGSAGRAVPTTRVHPRAWHCGLSDPGRDRTAALDRHPQGTGGSLIMGLTDRARCAGKVTDRVLFDPATLPDRHDERPRSRHGVQAVPRGAWPSTAFRWMSGWGRVGAPAGPVGVRRRSAGSSPSGSPHRAPGREAMDLGVDGDAVARVQQVDLAVQLHAHVATQDDGALLRGVTAAWGGGARPSKGQDLIRRWCRRHELVFPSWWWKRRWCPARPRHAHLFQEPEHQDVEAAAMRRSELTEDRRPLDRPARNREVHLGGQRRSAAARPLHRMPARWNRLPDPVRIIRFGTTAGEAILPKRRHNTLPRNAEPTPAAPNHAPHAARRPG
jgi:hypothetical protein